MAGRPRIASIVEDLGRALNALPGVFSSPQWGGRAYKLPGRGGRRDRPRLLAFVSPAGDGRAVTVSFKLDPARAADCVERHEWIQPHSFRTLAPSGWVTAMVSGRRQAALLAPLLAECHGLLAPGGGEGDPSRVTGRVGGIPHIDSVMEEARSRGWSPPGETAGDGWADPRSP